MNRPLYMAFEGGVCAGKTTISTMVARLKHVSHAPEYYDMLLTNQKKQLDQMTPQDQLRLFLDLDLYRASLCHINQRPRIADRSVLTMVATQYAFTTLGWDNAVEVFASTDMSQFVLPNALFYLDIPIEERIRRWRSRPKVDSPEFFIDPDFNELFKQFFLRISTIMEVTFLWNHEIDPQSLAAVVCSHRRNIQTVTIDEIIKMTFPNLHHDSN